ncbi:MAG: hypothetical protein ACI9R3_000248 [Verrucomicrobiales bacterium]|jgi:hypothetical protein
MPIRNAGRALALSKGGRCWWKDIYYIGPDDDGSENIRTQDLLSVEGNERRIKALLGDVRMGSNPRTYTLLMFFLCAMALAKARDYMTTATTENSGVPDGVPEQTTASGHLLTDPLVGSPAYENTWDSIGDDSAPGLESREVVDGEQRTERAYGRGQQRQIADVPESLPLVRDSSDDRERLASASMLNRPSDAASPHWWQNLRQDGGRGFGGAAERQQSAFNGGGWSDWHRGAGQRGAYTHSPASGPGASIDPDIVAGPLELDLVGFLSSEYTDNRELTTEDKVGGFLFAGGLNATATLDLTETNKVHLNIGVGVDQFIGDETEEEGAQIHVTPDTYADLVLGIGDLELRLFDRFTLRRNRRLSSFSPDAIDTGDYWSNSAGISAVYPLNDALTIHGTVDVSRDESLSEEFDAINNDRLTSSAGLTFSPNGEYTLGFQGTWSQRDYDTDFNNDADVASVGLFAHSPISDFTRLEANAGYQTFDFSMDGASGDTDQLGDHYASLAIRNELNEIMTHSLLGGHGADFGALSNFESYDFVRYELNAEPLDGTSIDLAIGYRRNDESGLRDAQDETLNASLHLSQRLTDHIVVGLNGAYSRNKANLEGRGFDEKRLQAYARLHLNESMNLNLSYQRRDVGGDVSGFVENGVVAGVSIDF